MKTTKTSLYRLYQAAIVLLGVGLLACEENEVNDTVPDFPTAIGISSGSYVGEVVSGRQLPLVEGNTAMMIVGVFSDRDNNETIAVDWTASGAVSLSGQLTIEAGTKADTVLLPVADNTVVGDTSTITFALSNVNPASIPFVPEEGRESVTFQVVDDREVFSVVTDTVDVLESDGTVAVPIEVTSALDEDVQVTYTVGGTAVAGVDYELLSPSPATIAAGEEEPSINIRLLNNSDLQDSRTLEVSVTSVTSTNEEVSLIDGSGTVVYNLSDDLKSIGFVRLDAETPVAEDTLIISAPGTYEVFVEVVGNLLSEATVEVNSPELPAGITPLVSNPFTLVPDEDARPYSFTVSAQAFEGLAADEFFSFVLENVTSVTNDNEVVVNEEAGRILVQLVAPE